MADGHTYCLLHHKADKYGIGYGQNFFRGICFFLNIIHGNIFNQSLCKDTKSIPTYILFNLSKHKTKSFLP